MNRKLKKLDAKETDPSLLYVREPRGRSVNEESHMCPIRQPSPCQTHVHGANKNPKATNNCLPLPIIQSTPASITSISPQSSSDPDTDHGDMIDDTIKHVTPTINQTLMTSNVSNTCTNKTSNDPYDNTPELHPSQDVNLHTIHIPTNTTFQKHKQNTLTQGQHHAPSYNV